MPLAASTVALAGKQLLEVHVHVPPPKWLQTAAHKASPSLEAGQVSRTATAQVVVLQLGTADKTMVP